MTRTGPTEVVMSARGHATPSRRGARPGFRELVSVCPASGEPTVIRAVFPGLASYKPVPGSLAPRSRQFRPIPPMPRHQRVQTRRPPYPRSPAHPLYLYLLEWPDAALPGYPFDPGRVMLCILPSPPRWLQWP
jgi:hypothetical protein